MAAKKLTGQAKDKARLFAVVHEANQMGNPRAKQAVVERARKLGLIGAEDLTNPEGINTQLEIDHRSEAMNLAKKQLSNNELAQQAVAEVIKSVREAMGEMSKHHAGQK